MKLFTSIFVFSLSIVFSAYSQWINLKGVEGDPISLTLLNDTPTETTIELSTSGYYKKSINIQGANCYILSIPKTTIFLEKGYPELPRFSKSVIIPDNAKMKFEILEAEYDTTSVSSIAPSKGRLLRDTNPKDVAYVFGDIYKTDKFWPDQVIELSDPFIMRDFRGITVRFNMFRYNAVQKKLITCKRLVIRVFSDGIDDINVKANRSRSTTPEMDKNYERFFLNYSQHSFNNPLSKDSFLSNSEKGKMLIIAADNFYNSMIPLRDWRTRKGYRTTLVRCSEVGTTWGIVKEYIRDKYENEDVLYILLVGEGGSYNIIPSISVPYPISDPIYPEIQTAKDPIYSFLAGEDCYADAYVSRISAKTVEEVENQVSRIIKYETNPVPGSWFQMATGIASDEEGTDGIKDWERSTLLRMDLLNYGYSSVDRIYDPGATSDQVTNAINEGRGIVNYTGHGNYNRWATSNFDTSNVTSLNNTNKLPFIFSVACRVGIFNALSGGVVDGDPTTCFSEAWLRSGTANNPKGAIAFFGASNSQQWIPPTIAQAEAIDKLTTDSATTVGGLCLEGVAKMLEQYPEDTEDATCWHIFGDAATHVWTKTPMNFTSVGVTDNGNSITVNAGITGATICVSSGDNGSSYWGRADSLSCTFFTSARPLYITVTKHNYIPYIAFTGGTITSNEYWFGNMKVLGNVVVNSGSALTIKPNTLLTFATGASLTVNGQLNAVGTTDQRITFDRSGTTGNWGSITLNGNGANNSTISYANIRNGAQINVINATNIIFRYDSISNFSNHGINLSGSTGAVLNSTVLCSNANHGIVIQNGTVTCDDNLVKKTVSRSGVGILYCGGGNGVVSRNDVRGWNWGIGAIWSSSPTSQSSYYITKNNRVTNCDYGLMVYRSSYPIFGTPPPSDYMWNSIYGNTKNVSVGVSNPEFSCGLGAYGNWWGNNPPNTSLFVVGVNSWFYYIPYLTSDPWNGIPLPSVFASDLWNRESLSLQKNSTVFNNTVNDNFISGSIFGGIELQGKKKFYEAKDFFISYLKKNEIDQAGYMWLYNCYNEETAKEITKYFEDLPKPASKDYQLLLSNLYLKQGMVEQAKANNDKIFKEQKNTELAMQAKLNDFYISLYYENEPSTASQILSDAYSTVKFSSSVELDLAASLLKTYVDPKNGNMPFSDEERKEYDVAKNTIVPSMLLENYPNPFNPSTVIGYQLSGINNVILKVYDILGREVAVLVNGIMKGGYHKAVFDGSHLASGIYFTKLIVTPQDGTKPSIQVKKMLLTK